LRGLATQLRIQCPAEFAQVGSSNTWIRAITIEFSEASDRLKQVFNDVARSVRAKCLLLRNGLVLLKTSIPCGLPIFLKVNHQLESRVRLTVRRRPLVSICPPPQDAGGAQILSVWDAPLNSSAGRG
jgi:hypothetical protein